MSATIVLIDNSGSLAFRVGPRRRIDILRDVFARLRPPQDARFFVFNSVVFETDRGHIPEPGGSTDMARAFQHIASLQPKPKRIVLLCDGEADDTQAALAAARALRIEIQVLFCGDEADHAAIAFCHALSWTSPDGIGGTQIADLRRPQELASALLRLTGPGK
jgi:hypothetical protein